MTTRRRTSRSKATTSRTRRAARRATRTRHAELREVIRLQTLSGRVVRNTPIPMAVEPASLFRTLP